MWLVFLCRSGIRRQETTEGETGLNDISRRSWTRLASQGTRKPRFIAELARTPEAGRQSARNAVGGAGIGWRKKRRPRCNGVDTDCVSKPEKVLTSAGCNSRRRLCRLDVYLFP